MCCSLLRRLQRLVKLSEKRCDRSVARLHLRKLWKRRIDSSRLPFELLQALGIERLGWVAWSDVAAADLMQAMLAQDEVARILCVLEQAAIDAQSFAVVRSIDVRIEAASIPDSEVASTLDRCKALR